jgi:hypothetical protein
MNVISIVYLGLTVLLMESRLSAAPRKRVSVWRWVAGFCAAVVGPPYKLNPVVTHSLKAPCFNPCNHQVKTRSQRFESSLTHSLKPARFQPLKPIK